MLDAITKTRIDSARDILVGKVPDPKSQVEQITIALIYKFMDDMDRQSEEVGGKATFFAGEFKKYRWANLLDKRYGGHERLRLYAEGIEKMNENKNIPQLFRDIFKGVFLPYRDPETLNLFLKEIDGFTYDHSERLGDAYEHLLNILATQGDAGQFRTPRHIIDFIVSVIDPQKQETVFDPACGTAGFLISAYKHILKHNENLTPDERARLMTNFRGYDIAPDMVRLSRVNLYLHGFPNPIIYEYDTLTSEERWDERCDVIMANPPFMSPKGGIRPHNRFSIKAKRSEVLFVDYIAEHLNPGGRAGIIVPEGIIFQSQNAYKALRRMLVENYLWAVVSLPAGVFKPYSGVKTSILFLDRNFAKRADEVIFGKVENDGFELGDQRRPSEKNDLPDASRTLIAWKNGRKEILEKMGLFVSRKRLLESPDCNFSADHYRPSVRLSSKLPMVNLKEVCEVFTGARPKGGAVNSGIISVGGEHITPEGGFDFSSPKFIPAEFFHRLSRGVLQAGDVLVVKDGATTGKTGFVDQKFPYKDAAVNEHVFVLRANRSKVFPVFLYFIARSAYGQRSILRHKVGAAQGGINLSILNLKIPIPPLAEQERIVVELEGYRNVIEGARQIVANYKPSIRIDPKWPTKTIGEIADLEYGLTTIGREHGNARLIRITDITDEGMLSDTGANYADLSDDAKLYLLKKNDVLVARTGATYGKTLLFESAEPAVFASYLIRLRFKQEVLPKFYWLYARSECYWTQAKALVTGGGQPQFNGNVLKQVIVPLPPLDVQRQIVAELEAERKLVDTNRELIVRMEEKIKAKLVEVWGEEFNNDK